MTEQRQEQRTGLGNAPSVDWQRWASCLPQSRIDRIALKTGFRTLDGGFNPEKSEVFNAAVNTARAKKLGLI